MSLRRLGAAAALGCILVVLAAAPASAHATLLQSTPAPGTVLQQAPKQITLRFNESVEASFGAVRVFNTAAERVDRGGVEASGSSVVLPVPGLGRGTYVVTWRVISADSHPVAGAFTFQIGNAGNATSPKIQGLAQRLLGSQGGDRVVGVAYGVTRWLVFAGLPLLIGGAAFALLVWPPARASARAVRLVWGGWLATTVGTLAGLLLYGPYAAGLGVGDALHWSLIHGTLDARFGEVAVARLVLLLLAVPVLRVLLARAGAPVGPAAPRVLSVGATLAVLLAATPGLAGHAVTGDWVPAAYVADVLHVLAVTVWIGGLVLLSAVLLPGRRVDELRATLPRWSRLAFGCVALIVATGVFQSWRQVGSLQALRSTDYGRLLIVKIVLFAVMLTLAAFGREVVLRMATPDLEEELEAQRVPVVAGGADDDPGVELVDAELTPEEWEAYEGYELHRLRRSAWAEVMIGLAVIAVTALLVNAPPAKGAAAGPGTGGAVGVTLKAGKVWVDITIAPGRRGANDVHVSALTPNGAPKPVEDLTVTLALPDRKIAPIKVPLRDLGTGHYLSPGFDVPIKGTWRVTAKALLSQFDLVTLTGSVDIGGS